MDFSIQTILENDKMLLLPLEEQDFEALFSTAADPKIWEQHPSKNRWQKEVFLNFFNGAIESKGAFKIMDKSTGRIAGTTRFYDYQPQDNSIFIGYTFYATSYWGKGINVGVKKMMLDYIFQYVSKVCFHIGAQNVRSQIAISRIGAKKVGEQEITYYGEPPRLNFVYEIDKQHWES